MARSRSSSGSGGGIRRSTSSSFGSKPAPTRTQERPQTHAAPPATAPQHNAPAAAHQQPTQHAAPAAPSGGGGLLSGLAGTVMQGMAFGGGSEVARRAIDGVMGPRTVVHEHQNGEVEPMPAAQGQAVMSALDTGNSQTNRQVEQQCGDEVLQFQKCLTDNNNNFQTCSFYFDVLNQCKKTVQDNAQWQ